MNEVQILPAERWDELTEIMAREFDADLPDVSNSLVLFKASETGKIQSFTVVETLLRVGQIYSGDGCGYDFRDYAKFLINNLANGSNVVAIASEPRFERLCQRFQMRKIEGTLYRRDF